MIVNENSKEKAKPKRKRKGPGCLIAVIIVLVIVGIGGGIGWSFVMKEQKEARNLPLNAVDFDKLIDGTYTGVYEGGMYKWRATEVKVTVADGKVTNIDLVSTKDPGNENTDPEMLFDRVIESQTLQVDTLSGATLTGKAHLQAVENALLEAQK